MSPLAIADDSTDKYPHRPRFPSLPSDHGLVAIISDPDIVDFDGTILPSVGSVRYMAPELLIPSGFGLENGNPTKRSDVYAFGVVTYQVSNSCSIAVTVTKDDTQAITGQELFPSAMKDDIVRYHVITGDRPDHPSGPNEWLSDDVWNFISRCWSPSRDGRPDADFAMNALNDAADAVEVRRRKLHVVTNDQGASHASVGPQPRQLRVWHDSTGLHRQDAALVDYKAGIVHLPSSDGTLLEIPESELCQEDIDYVRSQDVYKRAERKVNSYLSVSLSIR